MWNSLVTLGHKNNSDEHNLSNFKARKDIRAHFPNYFPREKETETQKGDMNCSRLYNEQGTELELELSSTYSWCLVPSFLHPSWYLRNCDL